MVWEERLFAEPKDVISIRLTCGRCNASLNLPWGDREYVPDTCPYCNEGWFKAGSSDRKFITWLIQSMNGLRQRGSDASCGVHFELPGRLNMPEDSR
jgi:ribosomal protein S27AE